MAKLTSRYAILKRLVDIPSACEVIPGIWLGDMDSSQDHNFHQQFSITAIFNCSRDIPFVQGDLIKKKVRIPVHDNLDPEEIRQFAGYLDHATQLINQFRDQGHKILIHCAAGMQRSAALLLVYHIRYHSNSFQKSYNLLKNRRPVVFTPTINFLPAIRGYLAHTKKNQS